MILQIILEMIRTILTSEKGAFLQVFARSVKALDEIEEQTKGTEYFETLIRYIMNVRDDLHITELIDKMMEISSERSDMIMTIADQLKKEGMELGIEKGKAELILSMINNGMSIELVQKYTNLRLETIRKILKEFEDKNV